MGVEEQERPAKLRLGKKKKQPQGVVMAEKELAAMAKAHEREASIPTTAQKQPQEQHTNITQPSRVERFNNVKDSVKLQVHTHKTLRQY